MSDISDADIFPFLSDLICKNKPNKIILLYIRNQFNELWSLSYLKKRLNRLGLKRTANVSAATVIEAVSTELQTSSIHVGIRQMQTRLRLSRNLLVTRNQTSLALSFLDPVASARRRSRVVNRRVCYSPGPGHAWSLDGYDKIRPYGIEIHGCLDVFSRKIIWLEAYVSNRDPHVIAHYFVTAVANCKYVPRMTKSDFGQEVSKLVLVQSCLRSQHSDIFAGARSHRWTSSTYNQTIEGFWSRYRRILLLQCAGTRMRPFAAWAYLQFDPRRIDSERWRSRTSSPEDDQDAEDTERTASAMLRYHDSTSAARATENSNADANAEATTPNASVVSAEQRNNVGSIPGGILSGAIGVATVRVSAYFERSQRTERIPVSSAGTVSDLYAQIMELEPRATEIRVFLDDSHLLEIPSSADLLSTVFPSTSNTAAIFIRETFGSSADELLSDLQPPSRSETPVSEIDYVAGSPIISRTRSAASGRRGQNNALESLKAGVDALKAHADRLFPTAVDETSNKLFVLRSTLWVDTSAMFKRKKQDLKGKRLKVTFADEIGGAETGIDAGGPRREYYRLLLDAVTKSGLLINANGSYCFQSNFAKERSEEFRLLGNLTALSALDGGPGIPLLNCALADFIVTRSLNVTAPTVEDVPIAEIRTFLTEVANCTSDEALRDLLLITEYERWGAPVPVTAFCLRNKQELIDTIATWSVTSRTGNAIEQFRQGLEEYGVLSLLKEHTSLSFILKPNESQTINSDYLLDLLDPQYTGDRASNKRRAQEIIFKNLLNFVEEIGDEPASPGNPANSEAESSSMAVPNNHPLTVGLQEMFAFLTGANKKPAIGLPTKISVNFRYDDEAGARRYPEAHTCACSLDLPVYHEMEDYSYFKTKLVDGIIDSPGFGKL